MKKNNNYALVLTLMLVSGSAWSYGGGGSSSTKACAKPKFSEFTPVENAEVKAGSSFSFTASANTLPSSITVTVKGTPVDIKVTPKKTGAYEVSGNLPGSVKGAFARIAITAEAPSNCNGTGGWLIKILD